MNLNATLLGQMIAFGLFVGFVGSLFGPHYWPPWKSGLKRLNRA